ncbi:hypothetical protein C8J38_11060 [Rhizobium sp. PP-WC-2G-219]|nr:hypothetical protein C8J38_11060 [Rhizobium sp. PP-WC-2G-219]
MTVNFYGNVLAARPGARRVTRDPYMGTDYNEGTLFIADFDFPWCYSGRTIDIPDGTPIRDVSENADGAFRVHAGSQLSIVDKGIDFSNANQPETGLEIPASVAATIWGSGQNYLISMLCRLPTAGDWNQFGSAIPLLSWSTSSGGFDTPELAQIALVKYGETLVILHLRQKAINDFQAVGFMTAPAGEKVLLAAWRTNAGTFTGIRTASTDLLVNSDVRGPDNTANFSAKKGIAGVPVAGWGPGAGAQGMNNWRLHRFATEALAISQRDPVAVLNEEWVRLKKRGRV